MGQGKAQSAGNGHSIAKGCNTALAHLGGSLRARHYAPIRGVAPRRNSDGYSSSVRLAAERILTR